MKILRTLALSLRTLVAYRARSLLAATGVAIGIAAVFVTSAVGEGAQAELAGTFASMGTRLLVVRPALAKRLVARKEIRGSVSSLKLDDFESIRALSSVEDAAPVVEGPARIRSENGATATQVFGTTPAYFRMRDFRMTQGHGFDEDDVAAAPRVAVLGERIDRSLFPEGDAVGQTIRIGGVGFEVVGVLNPKGAAADGADTDGQVFIPIRTAQRRLFDARSLSGVFIRARENELGLAEGQIQELLRARHRLQGSPRPDDFTVQNQLRFLSAQREAVRPLMLVTSGLAAISLLVGGTGILALMLLSVRERTSEIGLRKAVGARSLDILVQFLAEAVLLALSGGLAGVAVGALGASAVSVVTQWQARISPKAALVSIGMALLTGVLFGVLPARKAARMLPVEALSRQ